MDENTNTSLKPTLPARIKHECDVAGEKRVFRCASLHCPETLAVQRPDFLGERVCILPLYARCADGIFSATKRSKNRYFDIRQKRKGEKAHRFDITLKVINSPNRSERSKEIYIADLKDNIEHMKNPSYSYLSPIENGTSEKIRCVRCGYISKIEGAGW